MLVCIYRCNDLRNIGDQVCCPMDYFFPCVEHMRLDIAESSQHLATIAEATGVIVGGGGIYYQEQFTAVCQAARGKLIGWGFGTNDYSTTEAAYPEGMDRFDLLGVRDFGSRYRWVPCASCMSPAFDYQYPIRHEVVVYQHRDYPLAFDESYPRLGNNAQSFADALKFLGSGECVITNSYHGAYWATLLGRRVVICRPFSSKFYWLRPQVAVTKSEAECHAALLTATTNPDALREARSKNIAFAKKVRDVCGF